MITNIIVDALGMYTKYGVGNIKITYRKKTFFGYCKRTILLSPEVNLTCSVGEKYVDLERRPVSLSLEDEKAIDSEIIKSVPDTMDKNLNYQMHFVRVDKLLQTAIGNMLTKDELLSLYYKALPCYYQK